MTVTFKRQPKGTATGGQFAGNQNPETTVRLDGDSADWNEATRTIDDITYRVQREEYDDTVCYSLVDERFGGGWSLNYNRTTRIVRATLRRPRHRSAVAKEMWVQRGEANVRTVVRALEPNAALITSGDDVYGVAGRTEGPLGDLTRRGVDSGRAMLSGHHGQSQADRVAYVREFADAGRRSLEHLVANFPEMADSPNTAAALEYFEGVSLATEIGDLSPDVLRERQ